VKEINNVPLGATNGQQKVNKVSEVPKDSRLGILLSFDIVLW